MKRILGMTILVLRVAGAAAQQFRISAYDGERVTIEYPAVAARGNRRRREFVACLRQGRGNRDESD